MSVRQQQAAELVGRRNHRFLASHAYRERMANGGW